MILSTIWRFQYVSMVVNIQTVASSVKSHTTSRSLSLNFAQDPRVFLYANIRPVFRRWNHSHTKPLIPDRVLDFPFISNFGENFTISVDNSREEAFKSEETRRLDDIMIYSDASGSSERIGAAAILFRKGVPEKSLQFQLGPSTEYSVKEGELVGIILALHLLEGVESPRTKATINTDCMSAILATVNRRAQPEQYILDDIKARIHQLQKDEAQRLLGQSISHSPPIALTIAWVPGHYKIPGNIAANTKAKLAARGQCSKIDELPLELRAPRWKPKGNPEK